MKVISKGALSEAIDWKSDNDAAEHTALIGGRKQSASPPAVVSQHDQYSRG